MKKILTAFVVLLFCGAANAIDLDATITVVDSEGVVWLVNTTSYKNLTAADAKRLEKHGAKVLDYASRGQGTGGGWTMKWQWGDMPEVETTDMRLSGVLNVLKRTGQFINDVSSEAEAASRKAMGKPWGR
jgi:hypothetical protein